MTDISLIVTLNNQFTSSHIDRPAKQYRCYIVHFVYHGKATTADPMLCSSLFVYRIDINILKQALDGHLISSFITIENWPSG